MKLLLNTDLAITEEPNKFTSQFDRFDPSFSSRYLYNFDPQGRKDGLIIKSEEHWESDKYRIFYLDVTDNNVPEFLDFCKALPSCRLIAEADEKYCVNGNPLHASEEFKQAAKMRYGNELDIPQNIRIRPASFKPRAPN